MGTHTDTPGGRALEAALAQARRQREEADRRQGLLLDGHAIMVAEARRTLEEMAAAATLHLPTGWTAALVVEEGAELGLWHGTVNVVDASGAELPDYPGETVEVKWGALRMYSPYEGRYVATFLDSMQSRVGAWLAGAILTLADARRGMGEMEVTA